MTMLIGKKLPLFLVFSAALLVSNGCLHKFPYFIHEKTERYRNRPHDIIFKKAPEFVRDEVAVIPDFFQVDELSPRADCTFVYFASETPKNVYVEKIEIFNSGYSPLTIVIDEELSISEKSVKGDYFSNNIRVGQYAQAVKKEVASRLERAFEDGGFKMKLYFKVEDGKTHEMLINMRTKAGVGIALKHW